MTNKYKKRSTAPQLLGLVEHEVRSAISVEKIAERTSIVGKEY